MADTPKDRMRKKQIDVDHWQKLGEGMTPEQMFDIIGNSVKTHPGNMTMHRGAPKKRGFKKGGVVKKGRKRII